MDMLNDPALDAFQSEVRAFLDAALPDDLRHAAARATSVFIDPAISLPWQRSWGMSRWTRLVATFSERLSSLRRRQRGWVSDSIKSSFRLLAASRL